MARLVAFEGIDGSGKSTALAAVAAALGDVITTREETDSPLGAAVRDSISGGAPPIVTTFLFLADRAQHAATLRAHLDAGQDILCDRYLHSTLAYQSVTLEGVVEDPLRFLRRLHEPIGLEPDHVLLFRAPPEACVERTRARGHQTAYEVEEFLSRVQDAYLSLVDDRFVVIDADRPADEVAQEATDVVRGWLGRSGPAQVGA